MSFRWRFAGPLKSYKELKKLPPNISICKNPRDEEGKIIKKESEYDSGHSMCVNCIDGFLVKGYTYDTLYERLREKMFGEEDRKDDRKVSEAPLPAPGIVLYAVTEEPGHHRNGTGVEKVPKWENLKEDDPFPSSVHFFFQGTRLKIPDEVTASIKAGNDFWEARKKKDKEEQKIQNKKFNDDLIKTVDNLLEGL